MSYIVAFLVKSLAVKVYFDYDWSLLNFYLPVINGHVLVKRLVNDYMREFSMQWLLISSYSS